MVLNGHKLTKAQRRVADAVAMGLDEGLHPGPLRTLLDRGIVEGYTVDTGVYQVIRYRMPLRVHMQWAQQSAQEAQDGE